MARTRRVHVNVDVRRISNTSTSARRADSVHLGLAAEEEADLRIKIGARRFRNHWGHRQTATGSDCRGGGRLRSADSVRPNAASSSGQLSDNRG